MFDQLGLGHSGPERRRPEQHRSELPASGLPGAGLPGAGPPGAGLPGSGRAWFDGSGPPDGLQPDVSWAGPPRPPRPGCPARGGARHPALVAMIGACGAEHARPAGPGDHIAGTAASWVVAPADADQVARVMEIATWHELSVAVCGAGTKLDWGRPPAGVDLLIETSRLTGVAALAPPDPGWPAGAPALPGVAVRGRHAPAAGASAGGARQFGAGRFGAGPACAGVVSVGAGVPLRGLRAALAGQGLRWPLEVGSPAATVGGVLAADEVGPLAPAYGGARELVAGVEFVTADGAVVTSPVTVGPPPEGDPTADLAPLLIGSFGTAAVLTRATLRVFPLPRARVWLVRQVRSPLEASELVGAVLATGRGPTGVEVDLPGRSGYLAVLVEGEPAEVDAAIGGLRRMLGPDTAERRQPPAWWGRYPFGAAGTTLRLSAPVADLHSLVYVLRDAAGGIVPVRSSGGCGVVHAVLPTSMPPARVGAVVSAVRSTLLAYGGSCTLLRAPVAVRAAVDPVDGRGVPMTLPSLAKGWFDPQRRFVPGRVPCLP